MNRRGLRLVQGLGLAGLLFGLVACDRFGDICQRAMDCAGGNEADVDACVAEAQAGADNSSLWECDEWYDALFDCTDQWAECRNRNFQVYDDRCLAEQEDYGACIGSN
jgi:hypothetical protein